MQKYLPHIIALSNIGMRERHWILVEEKMGETFNYQDCTLTQILAKGA